jgi:putative nucleotidyltransferase with HDIG domain
MPSGSGDKNKGLGESLPAVGSRILDSVAERFAGSSHEKRNRFILLGLTALLLTFLTIPDQRFPIDNYQAGEIATSDIRAPRDYLIEDLPLTEKMQSEAEALAPYVYDFNANIPLDIVQRFEKALAHIKASRSRNERPDLGELQDELAEILGVEVGNAELGALLRNRSDRPLLPEISRLIMRLFERKIVTDKRLFASDRAHGILVLDAESGRETVTDELAAYQDVADARDNLTVMRLAANATLQDSELIKQLLGRLVRPNLVFNREATAEKKRLARAAVRPVLFQIKRGEMIVRVGERVSEEQALKLARIFNARNGVNRRFAGIGIMGLALVLFYFPYRFARKNIRKFNPSNKDLLLLSLLTLGSFLILKISSAISTAMGGLLPHIDTSIYYYLFPFAVAPILVRVVINSEVALVYCAVCAPLLGIMFNSSLHVVIYALLGGLVGAHGVRHCKDRSVIYTTGMKVSVVNLAMALSFQALGDNLFSIQTLYCALFALIGGIVNAILATGAIPLVETLFHYTTDIKLLELANLNSPILRELTVRAPGTYHHSVLVGNMVESAAETINANPLLARVAAYYHDIGKISKPLYFIENSGDGENRHDKLSPSMSALILISHVKEGVELAKEHRLGLPIIDIIRQSHGTGLISFFYQKAKDMAVPDVQSVDERDFRYPGPKPQTREAGLVLLADCVEAASRTLNDPTPARIQGMVQKIINNIFIDGQLDECELTLKNLHEIAKSFNKVLAGVFHHRIDYPELAYKEKEKGGKRTVENSDHEPAKTPSDKVKPPKKGGGDDLKRLGISR